MGDKFVRNGVLYRVTSVSPAEVQACGIDYSNTATSVTIPETIQNGDMTYTVTSYGGYDWSEDWHIQEIHLPNKVTKINSSAFTANKNLADFYIPASVTSIDYGLGIETSFFPKFHVDAANPNYASDDDGALYSKNMTVLLAVPSSVPVTDGRYKVKEGVTAIHGHVFSGSKTMTTLWLPKTISEINNGYPGFTGFADCNNLQDIEVEEGSSYYKVENHALIKITSNKDGNEMIYYPTHRQDDSFTVPDDVTELTINSIAYNSYIKTVNLNKVVRANQGALNSLPNLKTIGISASITSLDGFTSACPNIENYNVDPNNKKFASIDGVVFSADKKSLQLYPPARNQEEYTVPEGTTTLSANAFSKSRLKKLVVTKDVVSIGEGAISDMDNLTDLEFDPNIKIGSLNWQGISTLKSLKTITIPASVKTIGERGLNACTALEEINIPDNSELTILNKNAINYCPALKRVNFGKNSKLDEIGENCFAGFENLEEFNFPASLTKIDANAFYQCKNLKTITFAEGSKLTTLGNGCFSDCAFTDISFPNHITTIGNEAFRNCDKLTTVHFPASVTEVDPTAFKGCTNIMNYTVDADNTTYSATHGMLCDKTKTILRLFPAGHAKEDVVLLPPSITEIGENAFYRCTPLTSVVIPQKVKKIDSRAFGYCNNLKYIALLCDEIIPSANIAQGQNDMAFDNGSNGENTVDQKKQITLYVRKALLDEYKKADFWKDFAHIRTSFTAAHDGSTTATDEFLPISDKGMLLISTTCKDPVYVAPQQLASDEEPDLKRNVSMIDNYAFQNADGIQEVIFKNNIYSLGALAFYTKNTTEGNSVKPVSTSIKDIVFCGNTAPEVLQSDNFELIDNFREFAANQKIYVKKSKLTDYQNAMAKFSTQIDYKIPGVTIKTTYSTFCREFDTDFSDFHSDKGFADVAAFVAGEYRTHIDKDGNPVNYVHMTSIDENGGFTATGKNTYGYIPANTGVLLEVLGGSKTPDDFYYTIGEHDDASYTIRNNLMYGVTKITDIPASADDPIYIMRSGMFHKVTGTGKNFPAHRAYLKLPKTANAKAKLVIGFGNGDELTTGISAIEAKKPADTYYYNLSGQRVSNPDKGIFIHNGKKVVKRP